MSTEPTSPDARDDENIVSEQDSPLQDDPVEVEDIGEPARQPIQSQAIQPQTTQSRQSQAAQSQATSPAERLSAPNDAPQETPEEEIWAGRTNYKHFAGRIGLFVLVAIAWAVVVFWYRGSGDEGADPKLTFGAALLWSLAGVGLSAVIFLSKIVVVVLGHRYRITNQRLFVERGILSQTIDQMELIRVDDVRVYKSVTNRIFHLGTVELLSTDATDSKLVINGVKDADVVAEHIRTAMHQLRRRSLYVENL